MKRIQSFEFEVSQEARLATRGGLGSWARRKSEQLARLTPQEYRQTRLASQKRQSRRR